MKTYNISANSPYIKNVEKFKNTSSNILFLKNRAGSKMKLKETCK